MPTVTAKNILNKSIRNFICIDDDYSIPFQGDSNDFSREMYNAFHDEHKNIKILKYKTDSTVDDVVPYFSNADIVILDWKLEPHDISTTLSLLTSAILTDHVKYIFIYTNDKSTEDTSGLEDIRETLLLSMYNNLDSDDLIKELKEIITENDYLDDDGLDQYLKNIEVSLSEFLRLRITPKELRSALFNELKKLNDEVEQKEVCKRLNDYGMSDYLVPILIKNMRDKILGAVEIHSNINFNIKDLDDDVYVANNKLIKVISKKDMKPGNLVEAIHTFIESQDDSFFSILSHEILDRFKHNFLIRSKMYANIDDNIIKSYIDYDGNSEGKMPLKELVDGIYNDTFMSVLKNQELLFIEKAPDFFSGLADGELSDTKNKIKIINSFISIDHTKNQLPTHRNKNKIGFGDIFSVEEEGQGLKYAICITPHCDCAHPTAGQEYKFVFSHNINKDFTLENTNFDSDYCSFVPLTDESIKIVDWRPNSQTNETFVKATSLVISSENNINNEISVKVLPNKSYKFNFIAQQKESFTQRLLNESVRHSIRVGVSYLNTKQNTHCEIQS